MKLLESEYYKPIKIFEELRVNGSQMFTVVDLEQEATNTKRPYNEILNRLFPAIYLNDSEMVIQTSDLKDFERCTDYNTVSYNEKKKKFYVPESCYFNREFELFILTDEDLSNDYDQFIVESGLNRVTEIFYNPKTTNNLEKIKKFMDKYLQKYISKEAKISLLIKEGNNLTFKNHKIKPLNINLKTMYNSDFTPVHNRILDELTNSNKGLVLLHGIPGSGKTNYIKWLTTQIPEKDFIFIPNNMIQVLTEPSFVNLLLDKKNSIIVLEDCENYIAERGMNHNNNDGVASILNITDGLLSDILECQFICTFNAKITEIDHALLRKGRLIAEYYFDKLNAESCNIYLKSVGITSEVNKEYSLAEITHFNEEDFKSEKKNHIGF